MSKCRSCGAEIEWVTLRKSGKKCPIDLPAVTESQKGTFVVMWPDGEYDVLVNLGDFSEDMTYYRSHFATCPEADDWRSKPESKAKKAIREQCEKDKQKEWAK